MSHHSSISLDHVVDQKCVFVCVCVRNTQGTYFGLLETYTHIWDEFEDHEHISKSLL